MMCIMIKIIDSKNVSSKISETDIHDMKEKISLLCFTTLESATKSFPFIFISLEN